MVAGAIRIKADRGFSPRLSEKSRGSCLMAGWFEADIPEENLR
jgi:hypothetical protein